MVMMIGEKRNNTGVKVMKGEQNDEKKKGQKPMKERLVNKQRSVSCYDLQKGSRIEGKLPVLNSCGSSGSQLRSLQHDHWKPQYRSSSEPRLSFQRVDILHSVEGSEANLTNYEDDNTSITGWR